MTLQFPQNPMQGQIYRRWMYDDRRWISMRVSDEIYLRLSGGKMRGPILLHDPHPEEELEAVPKIYVDRKTEGASVILEAPPETGELKPGQLGFEPAHNRLWIGVDTSVDPTGRMLLLGMPPTASTIWDAGATTWDAGLTQFDYA